jgi:UDP-N-acetyl-D-mannosaminuronic acid dehydrogenase
VEPNIKEHKIFKLTDYKTAFDKADIVVFLTAHSQFKELGQNERKQIFDFCGVLNR